MADEILQGCLLHVRSLCEAASSTHDGFGEGDSAIQLVKLDKTVTLTLEEFMERQRAQCDYGLEQLQSLRNKVVEIVWESCAVSCQIVGGGGGWGWLLSNIFAIMV